MTTTSITVTKKAPALVGPLEPTPPGHLPLSYLDHLSYVPIMFPMIHVFRYGHEPAKVIREALAKALVPYYPVAGRIQQTEDGGRLRVDCTGEGVWFVEATASCSLADVKYLERLPLEVPKEELLPSPPHGTDLSALTCMLQVTHFRCGGFVLGFLFSHVMFDGIGVAQFMTAIGDIARGLEQPIVTPIWCREAIPSPPNFPGNVHKTLITSPPSNWEWHIVDISLDSIDSIKKQFTKDTGDICSVFDVVTAILWQSRTRAICLRPDAGVSLCMAANIRRVLHMEHGYYGNCVFFHFARASSAQIVDASLVDVIRIIRDAKNGLPTRTLRWLKGEPAPDMRSYALMALTDWRRLGFSETDYGWGAPNHVLPLADLGMAGGIILDPPAPRKGVRLLACCVEKQHADAFSNELGRYISLNK